MGARSAAACVALVLGMAAHADEALFSRTDSRTWSAEGAFDLRWGMGPGDALGVYSDLRLDPDYRDEPDCPIRMYRAGTKVGRDEVEVHLRFFEGRLFSLLVKPADVMLVADAVRSRLVYQDWVKRLRSKYGIGVLEERRIGGKVTYETWKAGGTSISLSDVPIPILSYESAQMSGTAVGRYREWKQRRDSRDTAKF